MDYSAHTFCARYFIGSPAKLMDTAAQLVPKTQILRLALNFRLSLKGLKSLKKLRPGI
jgi:hypothetical protein